MYNKFIKVGYLPQRYSSKILMKFNEIEKEIIYLKAIVELIDSVVNHEVLSIHKGEDGTQVLFRSMTHQKYFNIILVDFLSKSDIKITGDKKSYLKALLDISNNPMFDIDNSILTLKNSVKDFKRWLEKQISVKTWFPSLESEYILNIKRIEFIKICGNISKHNFTRLSSVVQVIQEILKRNEISRSDEDVLSLLDDFYGRFHNDIFNYHGSFLIEQLNNIRWAVQNYLKPTLHNLINYTEDDMVFYKYKIPKGIKNEFSKSCFIDLLNDIRRKPYVEKFSTYNSLKISY